MHNSSQKKKKRHAQKGRLEMIYIQSASGWTHAAAAHGKTRTVEVGMSGWARGEVSNVQEACTEEASVSGYACGETSVWTRHKARRGDGHEESHARQGERRAQ
jgi:hypothetical protein